MENTNSKSIVALTLGILSIIIPIAGLILGIIGIIISKQSIVEMNGSNENGKGLATSGKVCSIVGICLQCAWILLGIIGIISYSVIVTDTVLFN